MGKRALSIADHDLPACSRPLWHRKRANIKMINGTCPRTGCSYACQVWSGGAKVLGKLPVPERPTNLGYSRARAYCACSRCGWGFFGLFFSRLSSLFFLLLWETAQYRLKYCLKGPLSPKQPTNQPTYACLLYFSCL